MRVQAVYRPGAAYVTPADSLREAAQKMRESGQGCLPVLEGSSVEGIITERDLMEAVAGGVAPAQAQVLDYMNDGSVTVSLRDSCEVAELKMLAIGCRNLPVTDDDKLVGMVSLRDLFAKVEPALAPMAAATSAPAPSDWPEEAPPDVDSEA